MDGKRSLFEQIWSIAWLVTSTTKALSTLGATEVMKNLYRNLYLLIDLVKCSDEH